MTRDERNWIRQGVLIAMMTGLTGITMVAFIAGRVGQNHTRLQALEAAVRDYHQEVKERNSP